MATKDTKNTKVKNRVRESGKSTFVIFVFFVAKTP